MDTDDEAYHSGLTLLSSACAGDDSREDVQQSSSDKARGSDPVAGTPPKERSAMNIKGKLFAGNQGVDKGGSNIKPITPLGCLTGTPSADTPTSNLAGQLSTISFFVEGKFTNLSDSPTSEYGSGNFPSLPESDRGYASMPSPLTSLEKPDEAMVQSSIERPKLITGSGQQGEEMEVDHAAVQVPEVNVLGIASAPNEKDSKIHIANVSSYVSASSDKSSELAPSEISPLSSRGSSSSPAPISMLVSTTLSIQSELPTVVPVVAENVEVATYSLPSSSEQQPRQEGGMSGKRSATGSLESELGPSTKTPRLSPEMACECT